MRFTNVAATAGVMFAPGILLECATLTSPDDRERVLQEEGLRRLAAGIAGGIAAYRRNQ